VEVVKGSFYRALKISDEAILEMGIPIPAWPAGKIVEVLETDIDDWCIISCPNGMTWDIRIEYLTGNCMWEAL
jgi:hypothetical protein